MRLARNPGYPDGDGSQGYIVTAPLTPDGWLDSAAWGDEREKCTVVRFKADEESDADGKLTHRGGKWFFHYDEVQEGDDEPVFRLGDHRLCVGDYVTIHEAGGHDLTYRVDQHVPVHARASAGA
jgi:hypothetical protein